MQYYINMYREPERKCTSIIIKTVTEKKTMDYDYCYINVYVLFTTYASLFFFN